MTFQRTYGISLGFPGQLQPDSLSETQDNTSFIFITFTYICTSKKWWSIRFLLSHINWMAFALFHIWLWIEMLSCFYTCYVFYKLLLSFFYSLCRACLYRCAMDWEYMCTYVHHYICMFCSYTKDSAADSLTGPCTAQRNLDSHFGGRWRIPGCLIPPGRIRNHFTTTNILHKGKIVSTEGCNYGESLRAAWPFSGQLMPWHYWVPTRVV